MERIFKHIVLKSVCLSLIPCVPRHSSILVWWVGGVRVLYCEQGWLGRQCRLFLWYYLVRCKSNILVDLSNHISKGSKKMINKIWATKHGLTTITRITTTKTMILNTIIHLGIEYTFYGVLFYAPDIKKLDNSSSNSQNPYVTSPKTLVISLPSYPTKRLALKHSPSSQDMPLRLANTSHIYSMTHAHQARYTKE